jgi:aryl-alcohol dehydrogenase-like predicted oxidoreductase
VDYDTGLKAVEEIRKMFPGRENLAPVALRWILMFSEVSTVIPGASHVKQVESNLRALDEDAFSQEQLAGIARIYDTYIRDSVHHQW